MEADSLPECDIWQGQYLVIIDHQPRSFGRHASHEQTIPRSYPLPRSGNPHTPLLRPKRHSTSRVVVLYTTWQENEIALSCSCLPSPPKNCFRPRNGQSSAQKCSSSTHLLARKALKPLSQKACAPPPPSPHLQLTNIKHQGWVALLSTSSALLPFSSSTSPPPPHIHLQRGFLPTATLELAHCICICIFIMASSCCCLARVASITCCSCFIRSRQPTSLTRIVAHWS